MQETTVIVDGMTVSKHWVCLDSKDMARTRMTKIGVVLSDTEKIGPDARVPEERGDGWKEVEIGRFYNPDGNDGEVEVRLMEIRGSKRKTSLISSRH